MARHCKVCVSPSRRKIDRLLLEGQSFSAIGRRFGLSDDSIGRHFRMHVEKALQKARGNGARITAEGCATAGTTAIHLRKSGRHPGGSTARRELKRGLASAAGVARV